MKTKQIILSEDLGTAFPIPGDADLLFMDPPYNIGIEYGNGHDDRLSAEEYEACCMFWVFSAGKAVRPGGVLAVLISEDHAWLYESKLRNLGEFEKLNRIIWRERFAQYRETKFVNEHRHLFLYRKKGEPTTWNNGEEIRVPSRRMELGDKRAKGLRVPGDVWECPRLPGNAKARVDWHPCQLHPAPLRRLVHAFTNEGGKVFEAFSGSASLGVVCRELNRNYIGYDSNPEYVSKGNARIQSGEVTP